MAVMYGDTDLGTWTGNTVTGNAKPGTGYQFDQTYSFSSSTTWKQGKKFVLSPDGVREEDQYEWLYTQPIYSGPSITINNPNTATDYINIPCTATVQSGDTFTVTYDTTNGWTASPDTNAA